MKQLKVSLNTKQRAALEKAAKAAGRSLSEEIRGQLSSSLSQDAISRFARSVGEDAMMLAEIVCASALGLRFEVVDADKGGGVLMKGDKDFQLDEEAKRNFAGLNRSLVVALNEWFGKLQFEEPLSANPEADTIGRVAANSFLVLRTELKRIKDAQEEAEDDE